MATFEAIETQTPQGVQEALRPFTEPMEGVGQHYHVMAEAGFRANIYDRAVHLGYSALSRVRDGATFHGRILSRGLAIGLVSMGSLELATSQAVSANAQPLGPMSPSQMIFDINQYEASALNGGEQMNLRRVVLASHVLNKTGVCEKNNPVDPHMLSVSYSLKGIKVVECEQHPGGSHVSSFVPLNEVVYPPAAKTMELEPVLDEVSSRAAASVGIASTQLGSPAKVVITNQPHRHTVEADVFYNNASGSIGKELKELKLKVVRGKERVRKLWY